MTWRSRLLMLTTLLVVVVVCTCMLSSSAYAKSSSSQGCDGGSIFESLLASRQQTIGTWLIGVYVFGHYTPAPDGSASVFCGQMSGQYLIRKANGAEDDATVIFWNRTLCLETALAFECSTSPQGAGIGATYLYPGSDGPFSASTLEESVSVTITDLLGGMPLTAVVDTGAISAPAVLPLPCCSGA